MSATIEDIREALAGALADALPGAQSSAYMLSNPTMPSFMVRRGTSAYDQAMQGGTHTLTMNVLGLVSDVNDIAASKLLDQYLAPDGALSVKAALEADTSLGGLISDLHVTEANGEQQFVRESGGPLLGSEWTVEIWL